MSVHRHEADHTVVEQLVRTAHIEVIPLKGADEKLALVPVRSTVTVTCSVRLGLQRTLELVTTAVAAGHRVIPHLAARQVADSGALRDFLRRLDDLGVTDLYVIGGDAPEPVGEYRYAADLLEAMAGIEHGITRIGVAGYPEGHPSISDALLTAGLHRGQLHADYMVSQLCFDHSAVTGWLQRIRAEGVTLPLHLGLAAPMRLLKLADLSLRIGVGSSVRYLTKQHGLVGNVLRGSSYRPEKLLYELGGALSCAEYGIDTVHIFTFNQVAATLEWQAGIADVTSS